MEESHDEGLDLQIAIMNSITRSEQDATTTHHHHQVPPPPAPIRIPFRYIHPGFILTHEEIDRLRDDNLQFLLNRKKLHLILDLDHTLIHSINIETLNPEDRQTLLTIDDVYEILDGRFAVKLRPGVHEFLNQISTMFDLSIYTRATRVYAQQVCTLLDTKDGPSRFSWLITKEDCLTSNQKGLNIVLSHERVVLIVDDNEGVWRQSGLENLIKIEPYHYFLSNKKAKDHDLDHELERVLSILWTVYDGFYGGNSEIVQVRNDKRDVREVLKRVS